MRPTVLAALAALTGCAHPVEFTDDLDLEWDFGFFASDDDDLHLPYVRGTRVRLTAHTRRPDGWTIESLDPDVLAFEDTGVDVDAEHLFASALASGAGATEVVVRDENGRERDRVEIEVRVPTRVELHGAGARFTREEDLVDAPQVLVGGLATFQVTYWDGDTQLFGNAVLDVTPATSDLDVATETTFLFENREWVRFTPLAAGPQQVALFADGDEVATTSVIGVLPEAITRVEISGQGEAGAEEGELLAVLAESFDADGVKVYGVDYAWDRGGAVEAGLGDLYRYEYDESATTELTATFGAVSDTMVIHGDGWVDSSNNLGCATAGAAPVGWWLLALLGLRRRR